MSSSPILPSSLSPKQGEEKGDEKYYNLSSFHRPITTPHFSAQEWFNRGLVWTYAFNHLEAVQCFQKAISFDPNCCMAHWGLAYALGPNYNFPWEAFDSAQQSDVVKRTHLATSKANEIAERSLDVLPVERALISALQFRYPREDSPGETSDFTIWNTKYAEAMKSVYQQFPHDLDIAALYADALMNLTPWKLWDLSTGLPSPGAHSIEIKEILESALSLENGMKHPSLLHLYIHLMEMSTTPELALPFANHLRDLIPDAGHLLHMPSHIDILVGDYQSAITSNATAILADEKFFARQGANNFYTLYRCHDFHFLIYAAMFAGHSKVALQTVNQLENAIPESLLRSGMANWLEAFMGTRIHVLVRFGRWQDLLNLQLPQDSELYCFTTAMIHYGKGIAYAVTSKLEEAENQKTAFLLAVEKVPKTRMLFNNTCPDILQIASTMLTAEIAYRKKSYRETWEELEKAMSLDDNLHFEEPWGWMQPVRHAYGALLLEQGKLEEASKVYSNDLGIGDFWDGIPRARRHPRNVWALHGYYECLVKLGREEEAAGVGELLRVAVEGADLPIRASCFCRIGEGDKV